jgi:hypothetical protein
VCERERERQKERGRREREKRERENIPVFKGMGVERKAFKRKCLKIQVSEKIRKSSIV